MGNLIIRNGGSLTIQSDSLSIKRVPHVIYEYPGKEYYDIEGQVDSRGLDGNTFHGAQQSFTVGSGPWTITGIDWWIWRSGASPSGNVTSFLWTSTAGKLPDTLIATSDVVSVSSLPTTGTFGWWTSFNFSTEITLENSTRYVMGIHHPLASSVNKVNVRMRGVVENDQGVPNITGESQSITTDSSSPPTSFTVLSTNPLWFRLIGVRGRAPIL